MGQGFILLELTHAKTGAADLKGSGQYLQHGRRLLSQVDYTLIPLPYAPTSRVFAFDPRSGYECWVNDLYPE